MNTEHRQAVTTRLPSIVWFNHLDWMDRQIDAWVEAECGGRGIAHRRPGRSDNHGYHQSRQGGDMTHKLTEREMYLMNRAFRAGGGTWHSLDDWLGSERVRPGTSSREPLVQILVDEAPPAAAPVDYADLPKTRPLPAGFGQGVAIERMLLAQQETNTLLREIKDRATALVANAWATS